MLNLSIEIEGKTQGDLELAVGEVLRLIGEGYLGGANENDTGGYRFSVSGEEEEPEEDDQ